MVLNRRQVMIGAGGLLAAGAVPRLAMASLTTGGENLDFAVFRNGSEIGHHRLDIRQDGERTVVDVDILLEVGIGPLVLYRYTHRNTEIWENGTFQSFDSVTDDDGTAYAVRARRDGTLTTVERDHDEDYTFDDPSILPTTYWNDKLVSSSQLLDTQKGRLMEVAVETGDWQTIQTETGSVEARRFDISGDLNVSVWYDRDGRWTKMNFPFKGAEFNYVLV
jgi:hypothetical protein